jgi:hypothetical protein
LTPVGGPYMPFFEQSAERVAERSMVRSLIGRPLKERDPISVNYEKRQGLSGHDPALT